MAVLLVSFSLKRGKRSLILTKSQVNYLIADGKSHWLEGVLLMTLYVIIAVAAWFYDT